MDRVALIKTSLLGFTCGLLGLIPFLGFPLGVAAVVQFIRVRRRKNLEWNPANDFLDWGVRFALIGVVLTLLVFAIAFLALIDRLGYSSHTGRYYGED
jgi:NADH:ubiquinone oxidoreductase subunit 5 (subunit L)/multisubunit Na+/H+ antiporter MnhA subunit